MLVRVGAGDQGDGDVRMIENTAADNPCPEDSGILVEVVLSAGEPDGRPAS